MILSGADRLYIYDIYNIYVCVCDIWYVCVCMCTCVCIYIFTVQKDTFVSRALFVIHSGADLLYIYDTYDIHMCVFVRVCIHVHSVAGYGGIQKPYSNHSGADTQYDIYNICVRLCVRVCIYHSAVRYWGIQGSICGELRC